MSAVLHAPVTVDDYIAWALDRPGRYELQDGRVLAMAPERIGHALVKTAVFAALREAIKRTALPCHAVPEGPAIRVDDQTAFIPDALVYCGPPLPPAVAEVPNPVIVVEVLSPSTERRDRTIKVAGYARVASLRHYLIVDPDARSVLHLSRQGGELTEIPSMPGGDLRLDPPGLVIAGQAFFDDL